MQDHDAPVVVAEAKDPAAWDAFVASHSAGTVDHLWAWRDVVRDALHHESQYLEARRDGILVGVLPLVLVRSRIFGRSVVSMPFLNYGGVLCHDRSTARALIDAARDVGSRFGAGHVELRHRARVCPDLPRRQHKLTMLLSLPSSTEELWSSLDRKVRNQVRKAQKASLTVVSGGEELVDDFYQVFARNMRDLGTPVYPRQLFTSAARRFPDRIRVSVVRHGSVTVAAGVSLRLGDTVVNPWASSLREFRHLCGNMLLYWDMLEHAVSVGATAFDFGRSSPGGGTHQFKAQWGAQETPLCWEYILLTRPEPPDQGPSNSRFAQAITLWQKLPLPVANLVGPVVARHLP